MKMGNVVCVKGYKNSFVGYKGVEKWEAADVRQYIHAKIRLKI